MTQAYVQSREESWVDDCLETICPRRILSVQHLTKTLILRSRNGRNIKFLRAQRANYPLSSLGFQQKHDWLEDDHAKNNVFD